MNVAKPAKVVLEIGTEDICFSSETLESTWAIRNAIGFDHRLGRIHLSFNGNRFQAVPISPQLPHYGLTER